MNLKFVDGLLFASITIVHHGKIITVPDVVIDTGAAESIISIDTVEGIFNIYEPGDEIRFMTGIGGREAAVRRRMDLVIFNKLELQDFYLDFGRIGEYEGINGLIGLDILILGKFIIDLGKFKIYSMNSE